MPLATSICFFSTRSLCASDAAARICKSSLLPISNALPQRRCRRQSVYCTYLFFLHVFQTKFKRKKHLPPQVLQQKGIFHSKKFVFYSIQPYAGISGFLPCFAATYTWYAIGIRRSEVAFRLPVAAVCRVIAGNGKSLLLFPLVQNSQTTNKRKPYGEKSCFQLSKSGV